MRDCHVLLETISNKAGEHFSGMGVILYEDYKALEPFHCNLVDDAAAPAYQLGSDRLLDYLLTISDYSHPLHDGFHLINAAGCLTHVAQFLAPPIQKHYKNPKGQGARTYCAQSTSRIPGVLMVGSVSSKKSIYSYCSMVV
jgi:hypothetical protein